MGLRDPFTILRNVRDTTSPTAPSVDLVRFPSWRIARSWAWGVLIVYSVCALTIFGLASLIQHSADASKEPAATAVTATTDRNQLTR